MVKLRAFTGKILVNLSWKTQFCGGVSGFFLKNVTSDTCNDFEFGLYCYYEYGKTGGMALKIILVASGKGGTGKTSLTAGVSMALAEMGKRVLAVDGDCGMRNLDIALGMSDRLVFSFADVAAGMTALSRAAAAHPMNEKLCLLTAPGDEPFLTPAQMRGLRGEAEEAGYDYLIIDGPAGLPGEISLYASIATQAVIVTTPEHACIRGAEKTARYLEGEHIQRIRLVVNRVRPNLIRHGLASNIDDAMDLTGLPLLGIVPEDEDMIACSNSGKSLIHLKKTGAALACRNIARRLEGERLPVMRW